MKRFFQISSLAVTVLLLGLEITNLVLALKDNR